MEGQTTTIQDCFLMAERIEKVPPDCRTVLMDMVLVMYHHINNLILEKEKQDAATLQS